MLLGHRKDGGRSVNFYQQNIEITQKEGKKDLLCYNIDFLIV